MMAEFSRTTIVSQVSTHADKWTLEIRRIRPRDITIPRQQLRYVVDWLIGYPLEDAAEIEFRIESVQPGCSEH